MIPVQRYQVPSQQSLGLFSGEPASFFTEVVAGTESTSLRRWNSWKGKWLPGMVVPRIFFSSLFLKVQVVSGTGDVEPVSRRWKKRSTCSPAGGTSSFLDGG